jgi:hypothetical protein
MWKEGAKGKREQGTSCLGVSLLLLGRFLHSDALQYFIFLLEG